MPKAISSTCGYQTSMTMVAFNWYISIL